MMSCACAWKVSAACLIMRSHARNVSGIASKVSCAVIVYASIGYGVRRASRFGSSGGMMVYVKSMLDLVTTV